MTKFSDPPASRPTTLVTAMLQNYQAQQEQLRQRLANMPPLPPPPPPSYAQARHRSVLTQEQRMRDTRELCALISSILEGERSGFEGDSLQDGPGTRRRGGSGYDGGGDGDGGDEEDGAAS
jgi:hypothetical protein